MPRLTNKDYLLQRTFLLDAWNHFPGVFSYFTYNEQLERHAYFAPSKELSDQEAIAHRQQVTHDHPSLPHRAGKLYARLHKQASAERDRLAHTPATPLITKSKRTAGQRRIAVGAVARPEPDLRKLALALLGLAREFQAEERGQAA